MIKIVSDSLEEAYLEASQRLNCSITQINIDVVQYPRNIFNIFKKQAIVLACKDGDCPTFDNNILVDPILKKEPKEEEVVVNREDNISCTNKVLDNFYKSYVTCKNEKDIASTSNKILIDITNTLKDLFNLKCINVYVKEIRFCDEKTVFVRFDGKDVALLIGKNGYRYKAVSYLIFTWIFSKYNLFVKVEIGNFLANQETMIRKHLNKFIENIKQYGNGNTDVLDGLLLHLAVEYLREVFPTKMVTIKQNNNKTKYIKVCDFKQKKEDQ
jgi:spoIIIJ-associated protein